MDVSFLLPTARASEHPDVLRQCIDGIHRTSEGLGYEILVYSREEVGGHNVKWIEEDGVRGPIHGFNLLASQYAKGDYVACLTDDHLILDSIKLCIDNIESTFTDRKYKVAGLRPPGATCYVPQRGQRMGTGLIEEDLPIIPILRFPVVRKDTVELFGGCVFHPDLFYHAGDIWLGYYLYMKGEPSVEGPTRISQIRHLKNADYEVSDCDVVYDLIKHYLAGQTQYNLERN